MVQYLIDDLLEDGIISEIIDKNNTGTRYQPGIAIDELTDYRILKSMEERGEPGIDDTEDKASQAIQKILAR